jgi:hypothetical protein
LAPQEPLRPSSLTRMAVSGRLQPVAEWFFQHFERLLLLIADLRRYRGNILEVT